MDETEMTETRHVIDFTALTDRTEMGPIPLQSFEDISF
jgi:hypothetical protein